MGEARTWLSDPTNRGLRFRCTSRLPRIFRLDSKGFFPGHTVSKTEGWGAAVGFHAAARLPGEAPDLRRGSAFRVSGLRLTVAAILGATRTAFDWFVIVPRAAIVTDGKEVTP